MAALAVAAANPTANEDRAQTATLEACKTPGEWINAAKPYRASRVSTRWYPMFPSAISKVKLKDVLEAMCSNEGAPTGLACK